jgi:hypothetical protein
MGCLIETIRVMARLVSAIHAVTSLVWFKTRSLCSQPPALYLETCAAHARVDGRDEPGHDGTGALL